MMGASTKRVTPKRSQLAVVLGTAALLMLTSIALPTSAVAAPDDDWIWAVARYPSSQHGYRIEKRSKDANASNRDNPAVVFEGISKGRSLITTFWDDRFKPLQGNAQVTALTGGAGICTIDFWDPGLARLDIGVNCFNRSGQRRKIPFSVSFVEVHGISGDIGYIFAEKPSEPAYTPWPIYNHNADGGPNTIQRSSVGRYEVTFPGLTAGGTAQVSAYGGAAVACGVAGIADSGPDVVVGVTCRDHKAQLKDYRFSALYLAEAGPKGDGGKRWAYLHAHKPTRTSYVPKGADRAQDPSGKPRVKRTKRGVYRVKLPNMSKGGAAHVTASGSGKQRCNVSRIKKSLPQTVDVRCFSGSGKRPADSTFYLLYVK